MRVRGNHEKITRREAIAASAIGMARLLVPAQFAQAETIEEIKDEGV
jgi:hypothetical protein